jgi:hypothetical protein
MKDLKTSCYNELLFILTFAVVILVLTGFIETAAIVATNAEETKRIPPYMITTRGRLNYEGVQGLGYNNSYSFLNISQLTQRPCPDEIAIFVHGWDINEDKAKERFDRVKLSLENNSYAQPLVGLSWDSDQAWLSAKFVAKDNGPKLANFIVNTTVTCKQLEPDKNVKVRLIAHSLGARVVLSALDSLNKNPIWNNTNFKIASIHLMAAAVDDEEVSIYPVDILNDPTNWGSPKSNYGKAIQEEVVEFDNLFSARDDVLEPNPTNPFFPSQIYPSFEADRALGQSGYQKIPYDINITTKSLPKNYDELDVQSEIVAICDADADGKPDLPFVAGELITIGDNHGGYMGYRNIDNKSRISDDGAISVVVDDWHNITTTNGNQNLNSIRTC